MSVKANRICDTNYVVMNIDLRRITNNDRNGLFNAVTLIKTDYYKGKLR